MTEKLSERMERDIAFQVERDSAGPYLASVAAPWLEAVKALEAESISARVARLEVKPGETLVVKILDRISAEEVERLQVRLKESLPDGVKCIILGDGAELAVVAKG